MKKTRRKFMPLESMTGKVGKVENVTFYESGKKTKRVVLGEGMLWWDKSGKKVFLSENEISDTLALQNLAETPNKKIRLVAEWEE